MSLLKSPNWTLRNLLASFTITSIKQINWNESDVNYILAVSLHAVESAVAECFFGTFVLTISERSEVLEQLEGTDE